MERTIDPTLMPGARNAVATCMKVTAEDRVWILTDDQRSEVGEALATAVRERSAHVVLRRMEEFGPRPMVKLPDAMANDLRVSSPTVTILATSARPGEIRFRLPFARFLRQELRVRHAHMIGVTEALMKSGMLANYQRVATLTFLVKERMEQASEVLVKSSLGTELRVRLNNERFRWVPFDGLYHRQGQWGNLPEGELCTVPMDVNGIFKAELLGDYFCGRHGILSPPVTLHIEKGWLTRVEHPVPELAQEIWDYLSSAVNGTRVGEFAVGTNEALSVLCGNLLQDEKYPGVHIAFGNPVPEVTGAEWSSDIHVDAIATGCSIWLDGHPLMESGNFLV